MRSAWINNQLRALDNFCGCSASGIDWNDLVVVTVDNEGGHIKFLEVFGEVRLRESLNAFIGILMTSHHALQPPEIDHSLRDLGPRTVETKERAAGDILEKL